MNNSPLLKRNGARIRSELNDLKRTPESCARELRIETSAVERVLEGNCSVDDMRALVARIGDYYPVDEADLLLHEDGSTSGVIIMRAADSAASSRVFERLDRHGARTPYYEYRDTVMSRLAQFKPEWIRELRVVDDNDPNNPDVAYNRGHFMHQLTFFIGPVNFYYEVDGQKHCAVMNTGDSNYIMPFFQHSFASRAANQTALIIAVTFGGDVQRAQKEFYSLADRAMRYYIDGRQPGRAAQIELIKQHMANECMNRSRLEALLASQQPPVDVDKLFDPNAVVSGGLLETVAGVLNVNAYDLMMPEYRDGQDVMVKPHDEAEGYSYPSADRKRYRLFPLVRNPHMPGVKAFDIEVCATECDVKDGFENSLHTYIYNYSDYAVQVDWESDGGAHHDVFGPGDSVYVSPFVRYSFANMDARAGRLLSVSIPGAINLATQRELSCFADVQRVAGETRQWFD